MGEGRDGEGMPGGVGELLNDGAFDPGGVIEPRGEEEYRLDINPGGEPGTDKV